MAAPMTTSTDKSFDITNSNSQATHGGTQNNGYTKNVGNVIHDTSLAIYNIFIQPISTSTDQAFPNSNSSQLNEEKLDDAGDEPQVTIWKRLLLWKTSLRYQGRKILLAIAMMLILCCLISRNLLVSEKGPIPSLQISTSSCSSQISSSDYDKTTIVLSVYKGCYRDELWHGSDPRRRTLGNESFVNERMTIEQCEKLCRHRRYSGTKKGRQCYCGDEIHYHAYSSPHSACTMECGGDETQVCGGEHWISICESMSIA